MESVGRELFNYLNEPILLEITTFTINLQKKLPKYFVRGH